MGRIEINIRELAEKCGIKNAYQLAQRLKVPRNMGSRLWRHDFKRLDLETLARICEELRVQPGQALKFKKDAE